MLDYVLANKEWLFSGIGVAIVGWVFGALMKKRDVNAKYGGVAIGGNNHAPITITHTSMTVQKKTNTSFWDIWNLVCGIATLIGLVLAIIPFLSKAT